MSVAPRSAGAEVIDHEFTFSRADFDRVRELIYKHAGISLHEGKHAMVYSRLSRRLRETGHKSFAAYLQALEASSGASAEHEWQEFVNCLTTNLTSFFREEHHFHALADDLKPLAGKTVRIWCCAASTGEEPYSIAMTVSESLGANAALQLVCSDIDTNVLNTARRGVYNTDARGLDSTRLRNFFMKGTGTNDGRIRVKPELQRGIEFRSLNLMDQQWSLGDPFNMVFCRNVMIYFDHPTQEKLVNRMAKLLVKGGTLYVGHSESLSAITHPLRASGPAMYVA